VRLANWSRLKVRKGEIPRKDDTWRASRWGVGDPLLVENKKRRRITSNITR
jgi:hypothetical protein